MRLGILYGTREEVKGRASKPGTTRVVVGSNPSANLLSVEQPSGNVVTYDPRRLTGVNVYREVAS